MAGARIDCEQYLAFSPCLAHCHVGGALFCKWMATLGINPCLAHCQFQKSIVPRVLRVAHVPLAACKLRSSAHCHWLSIQHSKRGALGREQECARTGQARRRFAARQKIGGWAQFAARPKMGLCASCREAPAVVQRFGCQRSSEAARRLGADSRSRSNLTARGNHMPPHLSSEGFEGGGQQLKKKSSSFFNRQLNVRLGIPKSSHDLLLRTSSAKARCSGVRRLSA